MQGKQYYQAKLFMNGDLEKYIPSNHKLRKIDKILDLSFVRKLTESFYSQRQGRPSIDPEVFFRMLIISYLYGLSSDRELCEEIQVNLAFRWFLRLSLEDKVADHSSLTKIRDRLGEDIFRKIFEGMVEQCRKAGFIKGERMMVDATLVEADASIGSLEEKEGSETPERKAYKSYLDQFNRYSEGRKVPRYSNDTHESATDPDSSLVGRTGCFKKLFYKAHYSSDAESRIITDCFVTNGATQEIEVLVPRIDYQLKKYDFPIAEVIADRGYSSRGNYEFLKSKGIRSYIPLKEPSGGQGGISKNEFRYDAKEDCFICPQNKFLYRIGINRIKKGITYKIKDDSCLSCPLKTVCVPNGKARTIMRTDFDDERVRLRQRMKTTFFKSKLHERMWKVEGLFAEAKQLHCLRRARYRRREKVQIQVYMTAFVQNLKRLLTMGIENFGIPVQSLISRFFQLYSRYFLGTTLISTEI